MISGDLLHQVIKGVFKDYLVLWVGEYLIKEHGEARGNELLDQIDRRYVHPFSMSTYQSLNHHVELQRHHLSRGSVGSHKAQISNNGPGTTPRPS